LRIGKSKKLAILHSKSRLLFNRERITSNPIVSEVEG